MKCIKDPSLSGNLSCTLRFVLGEQQSSVEDHWLRPCLFYPQREVFAVEEAYTSHKRILKYLTPHVRLFIYLFHILFWFEAFYEEFAQKVRLVLILFITKYIYILKKNSFHYISVWKRALLGKEGWYLFSSLIARLFSFPSNLWEIRI